MGWMVEKIFLTKCSRDNLLARAVGDELQLAYGHHRLVALKQLGVEEIDIPVKDIDDATMLRIMANENMAEWKPAPGVVIETVKAAKDFIEAELAKYGTWEEFRAAKNSSPILDAITTEPSFRSIKGQGAGRYTIQSFLGWKSATKIEDTLKVIKEEEDAERKKADAYEAAQRAREEKERRQAVYFLYS